MRIARVLTLAALSAGTHLAQNALAPREAQAQTDPSDEGRRLFQQGRALFDQQRYEEALAAFQRSASLLPSPNTGLYVGRSLRELGRVGPAWEALEDAARDAADRARLEARYARTAETARAEADALRARVTLVTVTVPAPVAGMTVRINGSPLEARRWNRPTALAPGAVTIDADAPGHNPWRLMNTLGPGQSGEVELRLVPLAQGAFPTAAPPPTSLVLGRATPATAPATPRTESSPLRTVGLVTMGVGLALGVGGVLAGVFAQGVDQDLAARCPTRCPRETIADDIAQGERLATLSTAGYVAGGALAGLGVILFLAAPSTSWSFAPETARRAPVRLWVDPQRASAGVSGTF